MRAPSLNRSTDGRPDVGTSGDASYGSAEKFPDFDTGLAPPNGHATGPRWQNGYTNGATNSSDRDRWHPRRDSRVKWAAREGGQPAVGHGHGRQRSISNAIRHMRSASMSQNAHEIADALRAPVSYRLIVGVARAAPGHGGKC